ncbi:MAG: SRPBCC family protein [Elusimicrobia bacterium]|nr:SRPBCC family protein [Elusimicrobiota bacterium]
MREIVRTSAVPRPPEAVWAWLNDLNNLDVMINCLGWPLKSSYKHSFVPDPANPSPRGLVPGVKIALASPKGQPLWVWSAIDCVPNSKLTLFARRDSWLDGMHAQWSFDLENLEAGRTEVTIRLTLVFHTTLMELFTFNPIITTLYKRGVDSMLWTMKQFSPA